MGTIRRGGRAGGTARKFVVLSACVVLAVFAGGCGFSESREKAEEGVEDFHAAFNAREYGEIRADGAAEFREGQSEEEYEAAISGFRHDLGAHESSERTFFRGDSIKGGRSGHLEFGSQNPNLPAPPEIPGDGTFVYLEYESRFERMAATEQFLYRITDDGAELLWYHVSGDASERTS